jgi:para-aminobenzoate synthetase component I
MARAIIKEISYQDPSQIFTPFATEPYAFFLDSATLPESLGRYSFIGISPFLTLRSKNNNVWINNQLTYGNPFSILKDYINTYSLDLQPHLPPFLGGAMGLFGYDLCQHLEHLVAPTADDMQFSDLCIGFYDLVIAFDNFQQRAWACSSGFPETDPAMQRERALTRLNCLLSMLNIPLNKTPLIGAVCTSESIIANFSKEGYQAAVKNVIDYIFAGDIFQANISQRFTVPLATNISYYKLYQKLRKINPAPFSGFFNGDDMIIASSSPERFIKLSTDKKVETRPIKGTRPRGENTESDKVIAAELLASSKDRAENVMIVDLMRNDLSRVCHSGSIEVPQLCALESFKTVHHLVSVVTGQLKSEYGPIDLLMATFPGGSITGAPKIRAMEIIYELEPTRRGPYCGSMGYIGFDGAMDTSILIRTFAIKNNILTFQAGGAIVADSDPEQEYEETLHKSSALKKTLTVDCG